jgi:hypothetical protein
MINKLIANIRFWYNANMLDAYGILNQLHIVSDERCEEVNKKRVMLIFNDIFPRLGLDAQELMKRKLGNR